MRFQRAKSSGRFCTSWHTGGPTNGQATVAFNLMVPSGVARVAISEFPGRERVTACRCLPERCGGSGATFVQDAGLSLSGSGACGDIRPATPVASSTTAATTTTAFALSRNASGRSTTTTLILLWVVRRGVEIVPGFLEGRYWAILHSPRAGPSGSARGGSRNRDRRPGHGRFPDARPEGFSILQGRLPCGKVGWEGGTCP